MNKLKNLFLKNLFIDLIDEYFPKGKCQERGQAIVLHARMIIRMGDHIKQVQNDMLDRVEKEVINKQHSIFFKDNIVSLASLGPYKRGRKVLRKEQHQSLDKLRKEINEGSN